MSGKFIEFQTRKLIGAFGGIGSIIETTQGALLVEEFNKWSFFRNPSEFQNPIFEIYDNRLLERLQYHFKRLNKFVKIPPNVSYPRTNYPLYAKRTAFAKYFPEWMFCPKCESFKHINQWWNGWKNILNKYRVEIKKIRDDFHPPKCFLCYDKARTDRKKRWYYDLMQVRFIMTAPTGDIIDTPWEFWTTAQKNEEISEDELKTSIIFTFQKCCDNQDLSYIRSSKLSDLAGVRIKCKNCGQENNLAGLFGLRLPRNETIYKPVIRSSNSVYYPIMLNSLFLPFGEILNSDDIDKIKRFIEKNKNVDFIYEAMEEKITKEIITKIVNNQHLNTSFISENNYRATEYDFLLKNSDYRNLENNYLICQKNDINSELQELYIDNLTQIRRLKMTTVQTGYTRQEPIDKDSFIQTAPKNELIKIKYTSEKNMFAEYLPAIENFGEGIFFSLNTHQIDDWFNANQNCPEFTERLEKILERLNDNLIFPNDKFNNEKHLAKFILLHTLSHIIIKEFEFLCGYPATSLNERLYVDENSMNGLLIYTVAGAEGGYGGLIALSESNKLYKILQSALHRIKDCDSDPICYNSDGQGFSGLNFAACYSCTLLPETACEEMNSFLDRRFLIDKTFGFYKNMIERE